MKDRGSEIKQLILKVLEEWKDLQPNMESPTARELLATDLARPLERHINNLVEEVLGLNDE